MLSKCCCCVPLRTGSIILGIIGILSGAGFLLKGYTDWYYIIDGLLQIVAYGVLLFGAIKNNKTAVLVHLVASAIIIVLSIALGIVAIVSIDIIVPGFANNCQGMREELKQLGWDCEHLKTGIIAKTAGTFIVAGLISIYFWICNYCFYKELKKGDNNPA